MEQVKTFIKNHQEIHSGSTLVMYGVNSNDIIKLIDEDPMTERWPVTYYFKVTEAIKKIKKLFIS